MERSRRGAHIGDGGVADRRVNEILYPLEFVITTLLRAMSAGISIRVRNVNAGNRGPPMSRRVAKVYRFGDRSVVAFPRRSSFPRGCQLQRGYVYLLALPAIETRSTRPAQRN